MINPSTGGESIKGNQMALTNIRERLSLYYDLEARLETGEETLPGGARQYRVLIVLPCRKPPP
jgi:two-component system sensor histidine kinase AlgZ